MKLGDDSAAVTFCDGTVLHSSQCDECLGQDWTMSIVKLTTALSRPPTVDLSSLASLAALTLVTGNFISLYTPCARKKHREIKFNILEMIVAYCSFH